MFVNNISFPLSFSRRCDRLLPLLGSLPRTAPRLRLLHREDNSIGSSADQNIKFLNSFQGTEFFRAINEYLMYVSGILYYVSSTINPILYNLMSLKYRQVPKA